MTEDDMDMLTEAAARLAMARDHYATRRAHLPDETEKAAMGSLSRGAEKSRAAIIAMIKRAE